MPDKKKSTTKKNTKKAGPKNRRAKRKVVVEERTYIVPSTRVVAVRRQPVTLSRALGEAAVVEAPATTTKVVVKRKRA